MERSGMEAAAATRSPEMAFGSRIGDMDH